MVGALNGNFDDEASIDEDENSDGGEVSMAGSDPGQRGMPQGGGYAGGYEGGYEGGGGGAPGGYGGGGYGDMGGVSVACPLGAVAVCRDSGRGGGEAGL